MSLKIQKIKRPKFIYKSILEFDYLMFDFDGVFTDNSITLNDLGVESVKVSRADGFGLKLLKSANSLGLTNLKTYILSSETNPIVKIRANKINLECFSGINNKYDFLIKQFFPSEVIDPKSGFSKLIYVGNDLNDLKVIEQAGISFVPKNCHKDLDKFATFKLKSSQPGDGFVREIIELLIGKQNLPLILDHVLSC